MGHAHALEGGADVTGALPGPNHIAKRHGGMVEGGDTQAAVEGGGKKGITGAETGAQNAELLVALLLKPVDAATNVDHRLAAGGDGPADVGAHRIVGARQFRRAADIVVRLA